jgi:DNA mismatch repair protein MutH
MRKLRDIAKKYNTSYIVDDYNPANEQKFFYSESVKELNKKLSLDIGIGFDAGVFAMDLEVGFNKKNFSTTKNYYSLRSLKQSYFSRDLNYLNLREQVANAVAASEKCANVNRSEEFLKAGLTMKTIRVQSNGKIKEAMSFENIDYLEVAECDNWYESRLYELYSSRFLFVIFREQHQGKEDYILDDVFFWTMPQDDLAWAEEYWEHIRSNVLAGKISEEYWWRGSDRKKFHVRPKAQKAKDLAPTPDGKGAKKFCYWFNNDYVKEIVSNRQKEKNNE